jgi:uncharacterized protein
MTGFTTNAIGWFEIGTDDPQSTRGFYADLFGWSFSDTSMPEYSRVTTAGTDPLPGGIMNTAGQTPNYATFYIVVADVPAACAKAEQTGGKTLLQPTTTPDGLVFAQLLDPSGNRIGVLTPPPPTAA